MPISSRDQRFQTREFGYLDLIFAPLFEAVVAVPVAALAIVGVGRLRRAP
jgi:hypothetical protein